MKIFSQGYIDSVNKQYGAGGNHLTTKQKAAIKSDLIEVMKTLPITALRPFVKAILKAEVNIIKGEKGAEIRRMFTKESAAEIGDFAKLSELCLEGLKTTSSRRLVACVRQIHDLNL